MKYTETGFRGIYHNFCLIEMNKSISELIDGMPNAEESNGVVAYGYYDEKTGMTLEILAPALIEEDQYHYAKGDPDTVYKLRATELGDTEFYILDDDGQLAEVFAERLEALKNYDPSEDVEKTREMVFLDLCRDSECIDDVLVYLTKDGLEPEGCWTRINGLGDNWIMGTLLNEPNQNFGWHEGESIAFFVDKDKNDNIYCFSDMNPSQKITAEDLEGGEMLKAAVKRFNEERNEPNFLDILEILRDSFVWIPCNAIVSEADVEAFKNSKEGDLLKTKEQIRMIPDILRNGDEFFFPVFSSAEEMGEYGDSFSKIEKHMLEAIAMAKNSDKNLAGIVLNAFSEPFVLEAKIFDIVEGMKSRLS